MVDSEESEEETSTGTLLSTIKQLYLKANKSVLKDGDASYYYAESVHL